MVETGSDFLSGDLISASLRKYLRRQAGDAGRFDEYPGCQVGDPCRLPSDRFRPPNGTGRLVLALYSTAVLRGVRRATFAGT
jgi:hypothetical protein